jgi:Ca2+-binding EF-hand superfamily protein
MRTLIIATAIALGIAPAMAQQKAPTTTTPPATADSSANARFKAADKNGNGNLEGAELDAFRTAMTQVDSNKDGKLSRTEFLAGVKGGHIR